MSSKASFTKRLIVFLVGMPGYLLTLLPWMAIATIVLLAVSQSSANSGYSFDYFKLQYESLLLTPAQFVFLIVVSSGLWLFIAWFCKHILLFVASKFGESEKIWQITKVSALISGWVTTGLIMLFVWDNLTVTYVQNAVLVVVIGLLSIGVEYTLTRLWLTKT